MGIGFIPVVARVAWHSAGKRGSTPARLWFGGERLDIEVLRRAYVGPSRAGGEITEEYLVIDQRRRVFRIRTSGRSTVVEMAQGDT